MIQAIDECLDILTPPWAYPLLAPHPYKGAKGGRGSGKSHFFAESLVEFHILNPDESSVCIREIQKSLKFSAKKLIEDKIKKLKVSHLFKITQNEIKCLEGDGVIIFQGMQDHTADSIKSLEGFMIAWVEEAQTLSKRSLELLLPTIRAEGSEIWFSWNPDQEDDAVQSLIPDMICIHVNFMDNIFCPEKIKNEAERHLRVNPDTYDHVWLGGFNVLNDAQIFKGKFDFIEFDVADVWNPLHGLDWGFSQDPTAGVRCYLENKSLYIYQSAGKVGLELDDTAKYLENKIPEMGKYVIRADSARPESISYCKRHGLPLIQGVKKWAGSVEDGIEYIKSLDRIIVHPDCKDVHDEFRLYSYKVDKRTGDITKIIVDKHNHYIDAIRYAIQPFISQKATARVRSL